GPVELPKCTLVRTGTILLLLGILCQSAVCQKTAEHQGPPPIEPAEGRREAQKLLVEMLSQKPSQTNTGALKIRGPRGPERVVPLSIQVNSTAGNSTAVYEATASGGAASKLTVIHSGQQPNQYKLAENGSAPEKSLNGDEAMVPFAGSDFWVADLGLEFLHWPDQRVLRKELRRSQSCAVL